MRKLAFILALFVLSLPSHAATSVEKKEGRVLYSGSCASKYVFSYTEGGQPQRACIGASETVSVEKFVRTSRLSECRTRVRVIQGKIDEGVLFASDIDEVLGCTKD